MSHSPPTEARSLASGSRRRGWLYDGLLACLLVLATAAPGYALAVGLRQRTSLEALIEGKAGPLLAALGLSLAFGLAAFGSHLRDGLRSRRRSRSGAPFRIAFYALVGAAALDLLVWQPFDRRTFTLALGLAGGAVSLLLLLGRWLGPVLPPRLMRGADLVLFNLCLLLVGAELTLRAYATLRPSVLFMRPDDEVAAGVERARYEPGFLRYGFPVNRGGHYDVEFEPRSPGHPLVLTIGDSFSAGVVPHAYHFTTVAERRLPGIEVANMGLPALGPPEYLHLLLTEGLPLRPDVVVINLYLGNDFIPAAGAPLEPPAEEDPLRGWLDRENLLLQLVPRRLWLLARERRELGRDAAAGSPRDAAERPVESSDELERLYPWLTDFHRERPTFGEKTFLEIELSRVRRITLQPEEGYRRRFEVLRTMRRASAGTPLLFMVIPEEFQIEDALWDKIQARSEEPLDRHRAHRLLLAWLRQEGLPFLDLLPVLLAVPPEEDGQRHLYHLQDTHLNARGNRVVGEALAELVRPYLPSGP